MRVAALALVAALVLGFQNCSKVTFSAAGEATELSLDPNDLGSSSGSSTGTDGDGVDGGIRQPASTTTTGTGSTTGSSTTTTGGVPATTTELPTVTFYGPLCQPRTQCAAEFRLGKPMPFATSFYWRTNDTAYQTPSTNSTYVIGQPGVHYVAKGPELITFAPGETLKPITVQNINPYSYAVYIPVRMSQCVYGGTALNCSEIFK